MAFLSAEYLPGPHLANNLLCLGITEATREALVGLGYNLDEIIAQEEEPGTGPFGGSPSLTPSIPWRSRVYSSIELFTHWAPGLWRCCAPIFPLHPPQRNTIDHET